MYPTNSYVENLIPKVMDDTTTTEAGPLGGDQVTEAVFVNGIRVLVKEVPEKYLSLLPCEDPAISQQFATPKKTFTRTQQCLPPYFVLSISRTVFYKCPDCDILLQQPEQTKRGPQNYNHFSFQWENGGPKVRICFKVKEFMARTASMGMRA